MLLTLMIVVILAMALLVGIALLGTGGLVFMVFGADVIIAVAIVAWVISKVSKKKKD